MSAATIRDQKKPISKDGGGTISTTKVVLQSFTYNRVTDILNSPSLLISRMYNIHEYSYGTDRLRRSDIMTRALRVFFLAGKECMKVEAASSTVLVVFSRMYW